MASYSGQLVTWEEALRSKQVLAPAKYAFEATPAVLPDATGRYPVAMPGVTKLM